MKMRKFHAAILIILFSMPAMGQVGINTSSPNSTSILDLSTQERGLLIPRMTSQRRNDILTQLGTPAEGLIVYDTDDEMFYYYNPDNGDGNNTGGDQNWQALSPMVFKDVRNNLVSGNT